MALVVARVIRPQTPDIIRTASGEIFMDFGANVGVTNTTRSPGASVPPPVIPTALPPILKSPPSTRLCREQVCTPLFIYIIAFLSSLTRRSWDCYYDCPFWCKPLKAWLITLLLLPLMLHSFPSNCNLLPCHK